MSRYVFPYEGNVLSVRADDIKYDWSLVETTDEDYRRYAKESGMEEMIRHEEMPNGDYKSTISYYIEELDTTIEVYTTMEAEDYIGRKNKGHIIFKWTNIPLWHEVCDLVERYKKNIHRKIVGNLGEIVYLFDKYPIDMFKWHLLEVGKFGEVTNKETLRKMKNYIEDKDAEEIGLLD